MALFLEVKKSISKYSANMLLDHLNDNQGKINFGKFTHFKKKGWKTTFEFDVSSFKEFTDCSNTLSGNPCLEKKKFLK